MIALKQIDLQSLASYITQVVSGVSISGSIAGYIASSGTFGPNVIYTTGNQFITGNKTFQVSPYVPYSGNTGTAPSTQFVIDYTNNTITVYSGFLKNNYAQLYVAQTITGITTFSNPVTVAYPTATGHAVNLLALSGASGVLQLQINTITVANTVNTTGDQYVSGNKTFQFSPLVPVPTNPSGAVPYSMITGLTLSGYVDTTSNQGITGVKTFANSPIVPIATSPTQAVQLSQLQALGTVMGGVTGFGGVLSINGTSGASGNVYLAGAGYVSIIQCGPIFTISGLNPVSSNLYGLQTTLPSGTTGINIVFNSGLSVRPTITDGLEVSGGGGQSIGRYFYNVTTGGFNVALTTGTTNANYIYHFVAFPIVSGSGLFALIGGQGPIGPSLNLRGPWIIGTTYSTLDVVLQTGNMASYACSSTHVSTALNQPNGTGTANWYLLSSGYQGPTGNFVYQGQFTFTTPYINGYSAGYNGTYYGYTGAIFSSGLSPDTGNGWVILSKKGDIGTLIVSGNITGNFTTISYYLNPVGTGLNVAESFVGSNFNLTGMALGCWTSGYGPTLGGILTGAVYVRSLQNVKTQLFSFTFTSGLNSYISGGFGYSITGYYRIGIDVTNTLSGIQGLSVGLFGF